MNLAGLELARWFRRETAAARQSAGIAPDSVSLAPRSRIAALARSEGGRRFLQRRVGELRAELSEDGSEEDGHTHALLGSCLEKLGKLKGALRHFNQVRGAVVEVLLADALLR